MSTSVRATSEILRQQAKLSLAQGDIGKAERVLAEALETAPNDHEVLALMAELRLSSGRVTDAFHLYVRAVNAAPDIHLYKERFLELAGRGLDVVHSDALEAAVVTCLKTPELAGDMENWASLLMARPQFRYVVGLADRDPLSLDVELLLRPLFLEGLKSNVVCDPSFEAFVTQVRSQLLDHFSDEGSFPREEHSRLASALSHYAFFTDFILPETEHERDRIDELRRQIEGGKSCNADAIVLFACYRPLYSLSSAQDIFEAFRSVENLSEVVRAQIGDYFSLSQAAAAIPTLAPVVDETSRNVREQYETFPYPRWKSLSKRHVMENWRAEEFSQKLEAPLSDRPATILIAGCGTGRDAAIHAVRFPAASVTAVDISRASLAYASLKAQELGLENIAFMDGDILDLGRMGQTFDHICCTGVLHHMEDPIAGWRVLRDLVKQGGLMRIGLYSRAGRQAVAAAQDTARRANYPPTRDGLLRFRRDCPRICDRETMLRLSRLQDYYHLNMYRDLVFPAREHQFDLDQIGAMLRGLSLRFEGFYVSADVLTKYRSLFRDDRHATNLETWDNSNRCTPTRSRVCTFSGAASPKLFSILLGFAVLLASNPAAGQMGLGAPDLSTNEGPSNSAISRCNGGDPTAAVAGCTAIIQSQQSRPQMRSAAFVNRGRAYFALGQRDRALADFDAGVRTDPKSSRALANRGAFYQAQGDRDRAVQDYSSAISVNPRDVEAFNQRANVHMLNGDYDKAVADYDRAVELSPRFAAGYAGRGEAYRVAGELDRALRDFERAISLEPRLAAAFDKRGLVHSERRDYARAIADFDRALTLDPTMMDAHIHRALASVASGASDKALVDYDIALKARPDDRVGHVGRGTLLLQLGQFDRAIADFDRAISLNATFADAFYNRGTAQARKGDFTAALSDFDRAIALDPSLPGAFAIRGLAHVKAGHYALAVADLDRALALAPNDAVILYNRGIARRQMGDVTGGDADVARARAIDPNIER